MANGNKAVKKAEDIKNTASEKDDNSRSMSSSFFVIGIGASAGGINAINELISQLPDDLNAAIVIVLHLSRKAMPEIFIERIKKNTKLSCKVAEDNETIKADVVYFAAPDAHLLVKKGSI